MSDDGKRIIRQWNREIEDELRRDAAARAAAGGRWRIVGWSALWLLWLAALVVLLGHFKLLR